MTNDNGLRLDRLHSCVSAFGEMYAQNFGEEEILERGAVALRELVSHDDWLPSAFAAPNPDRYQQYLLHCDSLARFSIVSFVWGPGQETPIHNHTVWGLVGMLRGSERAQSYRIENGNPVPDRPARHLCPGDVETLSPTCGDIHHVSNALSDRPSISIHVYGANIGALHRSVFLTDGSENPFVSGYANSVIPNIWGNFR